MKEADTLYAAAVGSFIYRSPHAPPRNPRLVLFLEAGLGCFPGPGAAIPPNRNPPVAVRPSKEGGPVPGVGVVLGPAAGVLGLVEGMGLSLSVTGESIGGRWPEMCPWGAHESRNHRKMPLLNHIWKAPKPCDFGAVFLVVPQGLEPWTL